MIDIKLLYRYSFIICVLLIILFVIYNYKNNIINTNIKGEEKLICTWVLEDEISKFTLKQDAMIKSN
jgi:hypothetical protein